jgi:anaphase-promoting complex subunit 6
LAINKVAEARRYFSKASMMDPHFGPAWIGFAHTFAAENEHDQAISAYSTAARLFMGTHLPQLFLGMQNLLLNNMTLADEFLKTAYGLCKTDPLLLNEMGVVFYHQDHLEDAVTMFLGALEIAEDIDSDDAAWIATRANCGHAYRRLGRWDEALSQFDEVLRQGGRDPQVFCAKALVLMELRKPAEAVIVLHEALAITPQDAIATELLNKALDETAESGLEVADEAEEEFERELALRRREAAIALAGRKADGKGKGKSTGSQRQKFSARFSTGAETEDGSLMELSSDD